MQRRAIRVRGIVQGVGFRPFVYHLAARLGLSSFVRNQTGTLYVKIEGEAAALEQFQAVERKRARRTFALRLYINVRCPLCAPS